jgi:hypothetical protein
MKSRFLIFTSLVLAVLCLGSASNAMAQSVAGGGTIDFGSNPPSSIDVSARIGASGPTGIIRVGAGQVELVFKVTDLCVSGNRAGIVAVLTHSTIGYPPAGVRVGFVFEDNGRTGDLVGITPFAIPPEVTACDVLGYPYLAVYPLDKGNITVNP